MGFFASLRMTMIFCSELYVILSAAKDSLTIYKNFKIDVLGFVRKLDTNYNNNFDKRLLNNNQVS